MGKLSVSKKRQRRAYYQSALERDSWRGWTEEGTASSDTVMLNVVFDRMDALIESGTAERCL